MFQDAHTAHPRTEQLLQGPLKHIKTAALAAALVPLASVAAAPAHAQGVASAGVPVSGYVWNDANMNGVQDPGESPLANQFVQFTWAGGSFDTWTGDTGEFFLQLEQGTYQLSVAVPAGWTTSPPDIGDDALDSDGVYDGVSASVVTFTIDGDTPPLDFDFGMFEAAVVTDPGTATPGYWKTHPEAWPVTEITIGGHPYSVQEAVALLSNTGSDKRMTLFDSLTSAKLNVIVGNTNCVSDEIMNADLWMEAAGSLYDPMKKVKASSTAWRLASPWHKTMDDYNNGMLCAPHRD
ncbi:MAG: SdrD B-like domain-containing protein [Vicinamibacterales bacterium]